MLRRRAEPGDEVDHLLRQAMEVFMPDAEGYALVADETFLDEDVVARLYDLDPADVLLSSTW